MRCVPGSDARLQRAKSDLFGRSEPMGGTLRAVAAALLLCVAGSAAAQTWPARPVKLVVPFSPGAGTDALSRIVAQKMSEGLGQQIVIDNRPGAGGTLGTEIVAKA